MVIKCHHIGWSAIVSQFVCHKIHVGCHMLKELAITSAEIVESGISVAVAHEPLLGTFAIAGKEEVAFPALLRQHAAFHFCKLVLLCRIHHLGDGLVVQVAKQVFGKDEMVARINITIVLHHSGMATLLGQHAYPGSLTHPVSQGGIKQLYVVFAHIVLHPFVEDGAQECTPLAGSHGEIGHLSPFLRSRC